MIKMFPFFHINLTAKDILDILKAGNEHIVGEIYKRLLKIMEIIFQAMKMVVE